MVQFTALYLFTSFTCVGPSSSNDSSSGSGGTIGAVAGAIGGIALLIIGIVVAIVLCWFCHDKKKGIFH